MSLSSLYFCTIENPKISVHLKTKKCVQTIKTVLKKIERYSFVLSYYVPQGQSFVGLNGKRESRGANHCRAKSMR